MDSQLIDMIKSVYIQNSICVYNHKKPNKKIYVFRSWENKTFIPQGFNDIIDLGEFFTYPKRDNLFYFSPEIIQELLYHISELEEKLNILNQA